jgi:hypothetical protein
MSSSRDAIDQHVREFVSDLEKVIRAAVLEAAQAALGGAAAKPGPAAKAVRKPGRPAKAAAPKPATPAPAPAAALPSVQEAPAREPEGPVKEQAPANEADAKAPAKAVKAPVHEAAVKAPVKDGAAKQSASARAAKPAPAKRANGQKRTQSEIAAVHAKLEAYVKVNEGKRIEEISKALGIPTGELTRPMKKLMVDGKVRTTGERRATRYYGAKRK